MRCVVNVVPCDPAAPNASKAARRPSSTWASCRHHGQGEVKARVHGLRARHKIRAGELGCAERLGKICVHLRRGNAETLGLAGEVATGLVGMQVGFGHQVPDARLGQLPAIGCRGHELLEHRQARRLAVDVGRHAAEQAGDVPGTEFGQRPVHLDVGVDARLSRRKTLRIAWSPKTSDVLDCSPVSTRLGWPTGRSAASA